MIPCCIISFTSLEVDMFYFFVAVVIWLVAF